MSTLEFVQMGAATLFTMQTFPLLLLGIVIGLVAGSIPGLSASNTTAILLPTTLGMQTEGALVFMAAIYVSAQYGGSIPAILLKIPGTAGSGATALDGYPLAQKGKADYALGISLTASTYGGFTAAILAIVVVGPISRIALMFGPPDIFLLALMGIAVIVAISSESPAMGLLAGMIGIMMATMGADITLGTPRFYMGFLELYDSFPSLAGMIGLFAFTSIIELTDESNIGREGRQKVGQFKQILAGAKRTFQSPFILNFSMLIGAFLGALPGPGVDAGAFISYSQAKIWSKESKDFGKGAADGIIAPEAANNGVAAGALVPTMTIGVPGSGTMAIMLACLIMHGVRPGPQVMREYPAQIYAVFISMVVSAVFLWGAGYFYTRFAVKVAAIKNQYLIPAVLSTCLIGVYATRGFVFDMWLFLIFGIIGYILTKSGFSYVSLVLGVVMGALAEIYFTISINMSRGDYSIFFRSVFSWIMWVVILTVLVVPTAAQFIKWNKEKVNQK